MKLRQLFSRFSSQRNSFRDILSDPLFFRDGLSPEEQRILFRKGVHLVEMEPHAFCNRNCSFCLNGTVKNRGGAFPKELHEKVLNELAEIAYSGTIYYARYCEPLADCRLEDFIKTARNKLPAATLKIITNGDLLNPERLKQLRDSGLDIISISLYLPEGTTWSHANARARINKFADSLELSCRFRRHFPYGVFADFTESGIKMDIRCLDFGPGKNGFDRGGAVPELIDKSFIRNIPCPFVFRNFTIDWNGNAMPCCNLHSDFPQHRDFILGNIREQSIFSIYAGNSANAWRHRLSGYQEKEGPCRHCRDAVIESSANVVLP